MSATKMSFALQHFFAAATESRSRASTRAASPTHSARSRTSSSAESTSKLSDASVRTASSSKIRNAAPCPFRFGAKHNHHCNREKSGTCPYSHDETFFMQSRKLHHCVEYDHCNGYCKLDRKYCKECAALPCRNFSQCQQHIDREYAWEAGLCESCYYVSKTQPCKTKDCTERVNLERAPKGYCSDCYAHVRANERNKQQHTEEKAEGKTRSRYQTHAQPLQRPCFDCGKEMTTRKYCKKCTDKPRACQGYQCKKLVAGKSFCDGCREVNEYYVIRRR